MFSVGLSRPRAGLCRAWFGVVGVACCGGVGLGGPAAASRFVVCSCALVDRNEGRPGDQKNEIRERCALYMFVVCLCVFCGPNSGSPGGLNFEHVQALRHVHVFCCFRS